MVHVMTTPDFTLPDHIGRYVVVRLLGNGAMGRVLLAHDPVLDRDVAIKHLRDDLALLPEQRADLIERMRQEARASARVSHPNIIALHDMGEDVNLGLFLVLEYVAGPTLKDRLKQGPLSPAEVARVALEIGGALTMEHEHGVLHRDVKPDNIMLSPTGAKISDFGIARVPDSTLTSRGGLLGTPAYSAPEALGGSHFSALSDQFSLTATLYEALAGRRAFPGDDAVAVAAKISTDEPPRIAEVCSLSPQVDSVLARGLSKNPAARFENCEALANALSNALSMTPRPHGSSPPSFFLEPVEKFRSRPTPVLVAVSLLAVFGIGIGLLAAQSEPAETSDRPLPAPLERAAGANRSSSEPRKLSRSQNEVAPSRAKNEGSGETPPASSVEGSEAMPPAPATAGSASPTGAGSDGSAASATRAGPARRAGSSASGGRQTRETLDPALGERGALEPKSPAARAERPAPELPLEPSEPEFDEAVPPEADAPEAGFPEPGFPEPGFPEP
jgi:eukaryotic-like serine/threonine-protein kinase